MKHWFLNLFAYSALVIGAHAFIGEGLAAESAENLLVQAERTLVNSGSFLVDYMVRPTISTAGWPGIVLGGRLVMQTNNCCFWTNGGGLSIIPATLALVSDGKSHLVVNQRDLEWIPESPALINLDQVASTVVRAGMIPLVASGLGDYPRRSSEGDATNFLSLSSAGLKVTDVMEIGTEGLPGGPAHHIRFNLTEGTNQVEHVDLWLDERSGLPIKRVFIEPGSRDPMIETYAFTLYPVLDPAFFDPKRVARQMKLESHVVAAEKPAAKLLRGALSGNEDLVINALKAGADPNARTPVVRGRPGPQLSALMLAAMSGNPRIIERLVSSGAELNARAPSGATPLDFAALNDHPEVVEWLKSHGGKEGSQSP